MSGIFSTPSGNVSAQLALFTGCILGAFILPTPVSQSPKSLTVNTMGKISKDTIFLYACRKLVYTGGRSL